VSAFVLDNSVTMRWCFDSGAHAYADGVLRQLEADDGAAIVPVLWRYEVSAVLARAQNTAALSAQKVEEFLENLQALNIIVDTDGTARILTDVHRLAVAYRLTSYDAAYLELALRRRLPLASLDEDLVRACKAAGASVL
jgi:predicted nucleic acid-binding protein